jgi:hypothetical protein
MFAIDTDDAVAVMPSPDPAGTPGYFTGGAPGAGIMPTEVTADFMNGVQAELLNVVTGAGLAPSKVAFNQVFTAITTLINNAVTAGINAFGAALAPFLYATGDLKYRVIPAAPAGWVIANGATIGDAASGATGRANADTAALFAALWNSVADADLPIQDAGGTPVGRGGSAAADFAAHKRIPLLDLRGVVVRGLDQSRGLDAGRANGSYQADAFQGHKQSLPGMPRNGAGSSYAGGGAGVQLASNETQTGGPIDDGTNGAPRTAAETRMINVALTPLLKL